MLFSFFKQPGCYSNITISCGKVTLCHGYTLSKFGTNWSSSVEDIKVLLQHVNLSHNFKDILILHF